jgi:hypothetical protein
VFNFGDTMQTVIIHITNERTGRTYEFYDIDSAIEFIDNITTFDLLVNLGVYRLLITSDHISTSDKLYKLYIKLLPKEVH